MNYSNMRKKYEIFDNSINFSKYNLDDDLIKDFSGVDIPTAIEEFIGLMDIKNKQEATKETEIGIIMVIFPKEELVWINHTGWF